jgi:hypothetical protein
MSISTILFYSFKVLGQLWQGGSTGAEGKMVLPADGGGGGQPSAGRLEANLFQGEEMKKLLFSHHTESGR